MTFRRIILYCIIAPVLIIVLSLVFSEIDSSIHNPVNLSCKDTIRYTIGDTRGDYYLYNAEPVGYQFEMVRNFTKIHRSNYQIEILPAIEERRQKLLAGETDILICSRREYTTHALDDSLTAAFVLPDSSAWVVSSNNTDMLHILSQWMAQFRSTPEYKMQCRRYPRPLIKINTPALYTSLSPYDTLIKKYAKIINWDWRLLAALVCQESRFDPDTESPRGAYGLMQVMPATAERFGFTDITDPEDNIAAGVRWLQYLGRSLKINEASEVNRQKFILAAYNAGNGRINDCRAFAKSQGKNPDNWDEVASVIPLMKHEVHYTNDDIRLGIFNGKETLKFVQEVWERYENYTNLVAE